MMFFYFQLEHLDQDTFKAIIALSHGITHVESSYEQAFNILYHIAGVVGAGTDG